MANMLPGVDDRAGARMGCVIVGGDCAIQHPRSHIRPWRLVRGTSHAVLTYVQQTSTQSVTNPLTMNRCEKDHWVICGAANQGAKLILCCCISSLRLHHFSERPTDRRLRSSTKTAYTPVNNSGDSLVCEITSFDTNIEAISNVGHGNGLMFAVLSH